MLEIKLLHRLARLYNIQPAYYDVSSRLLESPPESIFRVLQILGAQAERTGDLADALRQRLQSLWQRVIDPVVVAWDDSPLRLKLRLPLRLAERKASYQVTLENGDRLEGSCQDDAAMKSLTRCLDGERYVVRRQIITDRLPLGYHRLSLRLGEQIFESHLFAAPRKAFAPPDTKSKPWGLFCPLYALSTKNSWGAGDFSDLETFVDFTGQLGGQIVGTLPLLAAFLDEPFNPSPYAPVSRLFWNELYLDVTRLPEWKSSTLTRKLARSPAFQRELEDLRAAPMVDYRAVMALKRRMLEPFVRSLLSESSVRDKLFQQFIASHPMAQDYAAFRATTERERKPWGQWRETQRNGTLGAGDYDEAVKNYHLFVQWQANEQMRGLSEKTKAGGPALYLDFPLGVNRDGYDVWRQRDAFAMEASGGAPPDAFFTKGQDWGFPPLHPEGLRRQGYRYYIHCLRHHLQYAGMLRIDHVMGLHRFYWVPQGFTPKDGVYVRYPAEEFYGILSLESHRHQAQIVGENLGTVSPRVNTAMSTHNVRGMYVGQFAVSPEPGKAPDEIPQGVVASLNTHDTPTFAGFWNGDDIQDRLELGLLTDSEIGLENRSRALQRKSLIAFLSSLGWLSDSASDPAGLLKSWLCQIACSDAYLLLVNLEDLWLEPLPQNVPGTWEERPNWKRKTPFALEAIQRMSSVVNTLKSIDEIRRGGGKNH